MRFLDNWGLVRSSIFLISVCVTGIDVHLDNNRILDSRSVFLN